MCVLLSSISGTIRPLKLKFPLSNTLNFFLKSSFLNVILPIFYLKDPHLHGKDKKADEDYAKTKATMKRTTENVEQSMTKVKDYVTKGLDTRRVDISRLPLIVTKASSNYERLWAALEEGFAPELRIFGTKFVTKYKSMVTESMLANKSGQRFVDIWNVGKEDIGDDDPVLKGTERYFGNHGKNLNDTLEEYKSETDKECRPDNPQAKTNLKDLTVKTHEKITAKVREMSNISKDALSLLLTCIHIGRNVKKGMHAHNVDSGKLETQLNTMKRCVKLSKLLDVPGINDPLDLVNRNKMPELDFNDEGDFDLPEEEDNEKHEERKSSDLGQISVTIP
uniref:Uncharacterized protein n=2 Tax=Cacopsylla melanoneura TaxID=428564 RepID=A0A8D9F5L3_9HEMI